jgi:guanylate kinase
VKYTGLILYGPPAAGKDTITDVILSRLDRPAEHFQRLKVGGGRTKSYRMATAEQVEALRRDGLVIFENERYGNLYVIDAPAIDALVVRDIIPIVHVGQLEAVRALQQHRPPQWLSMVIWCSRETAERRLRERGSTDIAERLAAWDETEQDFTDIRAGDARLLIDTDRASPEEAAANIVSELTRARSA